MFARHIVANFINLLIVLILLGGVIIYFAKEEFDKPGPLAMNTRFEVRPLESFHSVSERLEKAGIIRNARIFYIGGRYSGRDIIMKYGKYVVPAQSSMNQVLVLISSGRSISEQVTFPEGFTSYQVVERLRSIEKLSGEINHIPPEGSLAPNTYAYVEGGSRQDIIDKMTFAQQSILDQAWESRQTGLPFNTKEEALILASIIEKETGISSERKIIASVFINRLRKGMLLQTDPSVIYGLTLGKGPLGRGLFKSELEKKTKYNTYIIRGLPPTPIANPGKESIHAALNPAQTNMLYFVADGTGGHVFASTLRDHNANVRHWRKIEKQRQ